MFRKHLTHYCNVFCWLESPRINKKWKSSIGPDDITPHLDCNHEDHQSENRWLHLLYKMKHGKGGALPKFGEWDVNNPASADGFTVIFAKARDEKKATGTAAHAASIPQQQPTNPMPQQHEDYQYQQKRKWLCCFS
ncbi:protein NOI4-like isoform X1 [Primulina eburnea]|uniref:protein NOI4-like isoform X1 n=1 Tax=Primulina eburnea TaxID=1245227 RepID=UPI003C6C54A6